MPRWRSGSLSLWEGWTLQVLNSKHSDIPCFVATGVKIKVSRYHTSRKRVQYNTVSSLGSAPNFRKVCADASELFQGPHTSTSRPARTSPNACACEEEDPGVPKSSNTVTLPTSLPFRSFVQLRIDRRGMACDRCRLNTEET